MRTMRQGNSEEARGEAPMGTADYRHVAWPVRPMAQKEVLRDVVPELTRRIVEIAHPQRVILFGSAARGEMGPDSDLDVLVVIRDGENRKRTCEAIYLGLYGLGVSKDVLVATEGDLAEFGEDPSLVYMNALAEGKELYRAQA